MLKLIRPAVVLLFMLVLSTHALASGATEYFRRLPFRESPYAPLHGIHPISKEEAAHVKCFKFTYDEKGRPTQVEFLRKGKLFTVENSNRVLLNYFFRAPKIVIEYKEHKEIRRFYDQWNQPTWVSDGVYYEVFHYNKNGMRVRLEYLSRDSFPVEDHWGISTYEWRTDEEGRVAEIRRNLSGQQVRIRPEFEFYEVRLQYAENGYLERMYNYGREGRLTNNSTGVAYDQLTYDEQGNFLGWSVFNDQGEAVIGNAPMVHRGLHSYNANGYPITFQSFDTSGKRMNGSENAFVNRRIYNDTGDFLQSRFYDLKSEALVKDHPAIIDFVLDENGNVLVIAFKDHEERLMIPPGRSSAMLTRTYTPAGRLEKMTAWDADYQQLFSMLHKYDSAGRLIQVIRRDANDDLVFNQLRRIDSLGRTQSFRFLDENDRPVLFAGFHRMVYSYDKNWRRQEQRFDVDGKIIE